jgi:dienelactone hydrolase
MIYAVDIAGALAIKDWGDFTVASPVNVAETSGEGLPGVRGGEIPAALTFPFLQPMKPLSLTSALLAVASAALAQGSKADYQRASELRNILERPVYRAHVEPHWNADGTSFWYANQLAEGRREFVSVDALTGVRAVLSTPPPGADAPLPRLAKGHPSRNGGPKSAVTLRNLTGGCIKIFWVDAQSVQKSYGALGPGESRTIQTYAGHVWTAQDDSGKALGFWEAGELPSELRVNEQPPAEPGLTLEGRPEESTHLGPRAFVRDFNVWLKPSSGNQEVQLSAGGSAADAFGGVPLVSPDGRFVVAVQTVPAQERSVYLVESSPADRVEPRLHRQNYLKPGDRVAHPRPRLFETDGRKSIPLSDVLFANPWSISHLEWSPDGKVFRFLYNERGHQKLRVLAVDAATGSVRSVVDESSATFIDYSQKTFLHWADRTGELIWMSERDGWNHLWLYDVATGTVKNQITSGAWVVRHVDRVDEDRRQIWFQCSGIHPAQDPYHVHLARINFDGSGLVVLTAGDGNHSLRRREDGFDWRFSPDRRWFVATYSRADLPPVTELRRVEDGALVCELERADASEWTVRGVRPPVRFSAKGRDGATDIHGLVVLPSNFELSKKYPVIEEIYAGPHGAFVPKEWGGLLRARFLAELGFIVVRIDGMGTNWRSKVFHDVAWKNLKDAGLPDRMAWMRASAAEIPQMDLSRVGVFGGSAGGQNALSAVLHHGDFYKAAAADCGCHDNRMDKIWWNEAWMGWPVGPEYAENSNVTHAAKLRGKLLLTVGELDRNVDPASTLQVVRALIAEDKDFELLVVPGGQHGVGEQPYAARRRADFFVRHLLGVEPRWH